MTLEKSTHRRCLSFNCYFLLFFVFFFLRCNSLFNRNCSSLSHTFPNHQWRLVQSKVNLLEYKNRLCRHETEDRLFQLAFFFFFGSLGQLRAKVFTPPSLSCLVCSRFFNMEASRSACDLILCNYNNCGFLRIPFKVLLSSSDALCLTLVSTSYSLKSVLHNLSKCLCDSLSWLTLLLSSVSYVCFMCSLNCAS